MKHNTVTYEQPSIPHPCAALRHAAHAFHPEYGGPGRAYWAFDRAATYQDELNHIQSLFGIETHLTMASW